MDFLVQLLYTSKTNTNYKNIVVNYLSNFLLPIKKTTLKKNVLQLKLTQFVVIFNSSIQEKLTRS